MLILRTLLLLSLFVELGSVLTDNPAKPIKGDDLLIVLFLLDHRVIQPTLRLSPPKHVASRPFHRPLARHHTVGIPTDS